MLLPELEVVVWALCNSVNQASTCFCICSFFRKNSVVGIKEVLAAVSGCGATFKVSLTEVLAMAPVPTLVAVLALLQAVVSALVGARRSVVRPAKAFSVNRTLPSMDEICPLMALSLAKISLLTKCCEGVAVAVSWDWEGSLTENSMTAASPTFAAISAHWTRVLFFTTSTICFYWRHLAT